MWGSSGPNWNVSPVPRKNTAAFSQPVPGHQASILGVALVMSTTKGTQGLGELEKATLEQNQTTVYTGAGSSPIRKGSC